MEKVFDKHQVEEINRKISEVNVATDVGRIGSNNSSNYGMFTAQEWKNWMTIHSMYVLRGILPNDHLKVSEQFVVACRILCQQFITCDDVEKADTLLINFCQGFANIDGNVVVTQNMHIACHLGESLLDYGPVYGFWLFSFKRYNGEGGCFVTNNRSVEIQFMRKFVTGSFVNPKNNNVPLLYKEDFEDLFAHDKKEKDDPIYVLSLYLASTATSAETVLWSAISYVSLPSEFIEDALDDDMSALLQTYSIVYPKQPGFAVDNASHLVKKYSLYVLAKRSMDRMRTLAQEDWLVSWHGGRWRQVTYVWQR
jgi:hypothetical protein